MIYEYSRNTNKSKITVSCETGKSRTHLSSFATMFNPLTLICSLQHAFGLLDLLWISTIKQEEAEYLED